jgi:hypothetical protein
MMLDLSAATGFRLLLNPHTYDLASPDGFLYRKVARTAGEMIPVLRSPGRVRCPMTRHFIMCIMSSKIHRRRTRFCDPTASRMDQSSFRRTQLPENS